MTAAEFLILHLESIKVLEAQRAAKAGEPLDGFTPRIIQMALDNAMKRALEAHMDAGRAGRKGYIHAVPFHEEARASWDAIAGALMDHRDSAPVAA